MTARQQRRLAERKARKAERKTQNQNTPAAAPETIPVNPPDRIAINRANAQHSTGPRTAAGKLASSRNAFKHGLYSKQLILSGEDPTELDDLRDDLRREHQPATPTEEILVNELAEHYWRIRRMRKFETRAMGAGSIEELHKGLATLPLIQRTMAAAERGFHKALIALRQLQKERGFVPQLQQPEPQQSAPGFVSQNPATQQGWATDLTEQTVPRAIERMSHVPASTTTSGFVSQKTYVEAA